MKRTPPPYAPPWLLGAAAGFVLESGAVVDVQLDDYRAICRRRRRHRRVHFAVYLRRVPLLLCAELGAGGVEKQP